MPLRSPQVNCICLLSMTVLLWSVTSLRADEPMGENAVPEAEVDVEQPRETPTSGETPGYALPPESRSPFLPAGFYREQAEEEEENQGLTQEWVRNHVALNAVVNANGTMTAIINRTLLRHDDELTLEMNGQTYSLQIKEIKRHPPTAVLTHRDQRFTVRVGQ